MQSVLHKTGKKTPAEIKTDNWWHQLKAFTKEQPNLLLEQIQCQSKQFPKGNLDSTWSRLQESERVVLVKSVRRKKNVYIILLRLPETSNSKIQTGNTPRLFFPLFLCLHAAHVWYTPHPTDAIFHAAMLVDCRQMTRKLKNICA